MPNAFDRYSHCSFIGKEGERTVEHPVVNAEINT
jgi:hypothetical protein